MRMTRQAVKLVVCAALLGGLAACSREQKQYGEAIDPDAKVVSVDEVVKNPSAFEGRMLTVEGRMGDICSDGEDFDLKGKFELAEVIPPGGKMPPKSFKGKPAKVYGKLLVKHEKTEKGKESEVKIMANGIQFE